jgi:hypothetical protein
LVVLLDEQILRPADKALIDDRLEVEIAFPDLRELNDPVKCRHEGLEVTCLQELEGARRELTDAIVLQMYEVHQAGVVIENAHRVLSAAMNPVDIQLELHQWSALPDDVQDVLAVILGELDVVVVVAQRDALLGKPGGHLVAPAAEVEKGVLGGHGRERHHAHANKPAVKPHAVRHDLVEIVPERVSGRAYRSLESRGQSGDFHAELDPRTLDLGDVVFRHGNLGDLNGVEPQFIQPLQRCERTICLELVLEHHGLDTDSCHSNSFVSLPWRFSAVTGVLDPLVRYARRSPSG